MGWLYPLGASKGLERIECPPSWLYNWSSFANVILARDESSRSWTRPAPSLHAYVIAWIRGCTHNSRTRFHSLRYFQLDFQNYPIFFPVRLNSNELSSPINGQRYLAVIRFPFFQFKNLGKSWNWILPRPDTNLPATCRSLNYASTGLDASRKV